MKDKRTRFFLTLSVVINLLLIGITFGHILHCSLLSAHTNTPTSIAQLPEERRIYIENNMRVIMQQVDTSREHISVEKKIALNLLKAEPYNEKAYLKQAGHVIEMYMQMRKNMAESVADLAAKLSPQERAVLADIVAQPLPLLKSEKP